MDRELYNVGDSSRVHNIMYAIWDAYEVARNIKGENRNEKTV